MKTSKQDFGQIDDGNVIMFGEIPVEISSNPSIVTDIGTTGTNKVPAKKSKSKYDKTAVNANNNTNSNTNTNTSQLANRAETSTKSVSTAASNKKESKMGSTSPPATLGNEVKKQTILSMLNKK